uniref:DNA replication protein n=4 Tax=unclassified bacterial viruses TaxID=12333 RepID=A0AAU6W3I9_9VIRU
MSNWVKLSRKLATSAIAAKPEYLAVWIHLLMAASYKAGDVLVGRQVVRLNPGQLVFGRHKFSEKTGVSEGTIRSALKVLESLQQITIKSESKFSVISITNWAFYQGEQPANNQIRTSSEPAVNHNKEVQELQEEDQKLLRKPAVADLDEEGLKAPRAKPVPYAEIFDAYSRILPSLPQPTLRDDARKNAIRLRWQMDERFQTVDFWVEYFEYIKGCQFLMGMKGACFDWFFKPANFKKVIDGNYDNA